jgi:hypothetical protein
MQFPVLTSPRRVVPPEVSALRPSHIKRSGKSRSSRLELYREKGLRAWKRSVSPKNPSDTGAVASSQKQMFGDARGAVRVHWRRLVSGSKNHMTSQRCAMISDISQDLEIREPRKIPQQASHDFVLKPEWLEPSDTYGWRATARNVIPLLAFLGMAPALSRGKCLRAMAPHSCDRLVSLSNHRGDARLHSPHAACQSHD